MAEIKKRILECPNCKAEIEVQIRPRLEMPYDQEEKKKIMDGMFFRNKCPGCGRLIPAIYNFEYNDMENKYLIWLLPQIHEEEKKRIIDFNQLLATDNRLRLAQGGYRYRLVMTDMELREKVLIFDEGFDDRFIEAMKVIYVPVIMEKVGNDCQVVGIFFDKSAEGEYQWLVVFDKMKPTIFTVNMDMYEDMKEKLWETAEKNYQDDCMLMIEAHWAAKVMKECSEAENQ
ncbi:MAG: CpXC domain-containing protein [Eubacteriales bacterium]|nr:CpXC domain-containing protein [Eubacteriales bacterium]